MPVWYYLAFIRVTQQNKTYFTQWLTENLRNNLFLARRLDCGEYKYFVERKIFRRWKELITSLSFSLVPGLLGHTTPHCPDIQAKFQLLHNFEFCGFAQQHISPEMAFRWSKLVCNLTRPGRANRCFFELRNGLYNWPSTSRRVGTTVGTKGKLNY